MAKSLVKSVPEGMHTLTAHLVCADAAAAIEYYKKALGGIEVSRMPGPDGKLAHAVLKIGDSTLFLVDEIPQHGVLGPKARNGSSVTIHMSVDDAAAVLERAVATGAEVTRSPRRRTRAGRGGCRRCGGEWTAPDRAKTALTVMISQLRWWAVALRNARQTVDYGALAA
jgi:uncharacterized glyoxalase superfamily protein PhnB